MERLMMKRDPQELPLSLGNGRGEYRIQKVVGGFLHRQLFTFVSTFLGWEPSNRQNKKYRTDWWGWIMATTQDFREYITQNQQAFYRLAYSYTKNSDAALDVVQDAVVKGIEKLHTLRNPAYMKTWFYRILVNQALTYLRGKKVVSLEEYTESTCPAAEEQDVAQNVDLYRAVQGLEPILRTIVILRFFEDMKLEDIAAITGAPLSTVKSRLYKALKLLKVDLQGEVVTT